MRKLSVTHVLDCDVATFWKTFFDDEYNQRLYKDGLSFKSFEILERSEGKRRMRGVPKLNAPAPVAKLLGDSFGYEEQGSFDEAASLYRWKMIPNTLTDKLTTQGTVKVEASGEGKVRRVSEASIEAKVFGLGGILESTAEKEIRDGWEKEAAFMNRWLREKKA